MIHFGPLNESFEHVCWTFFSDFSQAAYAEKTPLEEATELRQYAKCIDGIMNEMAGEHKKIAKRYPEFKELAEKTNLQLDECLKINDVESNISKAE